MMIELQRFWMREDLDTVGRLMIGSQMICYTFELPWKDNAQSVSCIPCGVFHTQFNQNKNRFEVHDVPHRSGIQIHIGNYAREIKGCILPGLGVRMLPEAQAVDSVLAFKRLKEMAKDDFILSVRGML